MTKNSEVERSGVRQTDATRGRRGTGIAGQRGTRFIDSAGNDVVSHTWQVIGLTVSGDDDDPSVLSAGGSGGSVDLSGVYTKDESDDLFLLRRDGEGHEVATYTASGAALTLDLSAANIHDVTLTANCTLIFTNPPASGVLGQWTIILRQDATGSRTVTWPGTVDWQDTDGTGGGAAPTLYTAATAEDVIVITTLDGGTTYGAGSERVTSSAGSVATDSIWDAKGDLAAGTGANTASKLTVGANDTILMADSAQATGLKWVATQTPTDLDYDDVAAAGTADTFSRGDHLHGMPSAGSGGSVATDSIWDAAGDLAKGTGANTADVLTKGAAGTVLVAGATTISWVDVLPWHIWIIPMIATPDATTGTWALTSGHTDSAVVYPFYVPGSTANSGGASDIANNTGVAINDAIAYDVILAAGTWDFHCWVRKSTNTGIITLQQDGSDMGTVDTYAAAAAAAKVSITGWTVSTTGKKRMNLKMASKNASSSNYILTMFGIEFRRTA